MSSPASLSSSPAAAPLAEIEIVLNGDRRSIRAGSTVVDLLEELELGTERVAVEVDKKIVRRAEWSGCELSAGAAVEIVHFVGGG